MACPTVGTLLSTTLMGGHKLANAWPVASLWLKCVKRYHLCPFTALMNFKGKYKLGFQLTVRTQFLFICQSDYMFRPSLGHHQVTSTSYNTCYNLHVYTYIMSADHREIT